MSNEILYTSEETFDLIQTLWVRGDVDKNICVDKATMAIEIANAVEQGHELAITYTHRCEDEPNRVYGELIKKTVLVDGKGPYRLLDLDSGWLKFIVGGEEYSIDCTDVEYYFHEGMQVLNRTLPLEQLKSILSELFGFDVQKYDDEHYDKNMRNRGGYVIYDSDGKEFFAEGEELYDRNNMWELNTLAGIFEYHAHIKSEEGAEGVRKAIRETLGIKPEPMP